MNYLEIAKKKLEELSEIEFLSEKNEILKNTIITSLIEGGDNVSIVEKINSKYDEIVKEINENTNIQIITKNKNNEDILTMISELIEDHKEQANLKKIESLEQKLINNMDESSYSELIKLKSQLNRD